MGDYKQKDPVDEFILEDDIVKCSECGSRKLIRDEKSELFCDDCGLVLEEKIIGQESRREDLGHEQGDQHTLPESRTEVQIQLDNAEFAKKDYSGKFLTAQQRKWSLRNLLCQRNSRKDERSGAQKLGEEQLKWLVANNKLSRHYKVEVGDIFKKAIEKKKANRADKNTNTRGSFLTAGLPNDAAPASAVAACIFHCRRNNEPKILLDDFIDEQCELSEQNVTPCGRFAGNHKLFRKQVKRALKHVDEIFQRKEKSGSMAQALDIPKGMQRVKDQSYVRDEFIGVVRVIGDLIPNLTKADEEKIGEVLQDYESLPPTSNGRMGLSLEICYQLAKLDGQKYKRDDFVKGMGFKIKAKRIGQEYNPMAETVIGRAGIVESGNKEHSIKRSDSDKGERKDENS